MVNTKKMKGLVYELIEKYPEEKEILEELLSAYENPYYHYCTLSAISCIEDHNIPKETVEYEKIIDGTADDLYMQNQDDDWDVFEVMMQNVERHRIDIDDECNAVSEQYECGGVYHHNYMDILGCRSHDYFWDCSSCKYK